MCGFVGFMDESADNNASDYLLSEMAKCIAHRGPDDEGIWLDQTNGIGMAHRRLSILDLSEAGHQPMTSASGRYVFAFNGEIYNYLDLRTKLKTEKDIKWRGHSDTETLLAGFEKWGIVPTLKKCIGMFAFALWDKQLKILTLGRDRLGEKPLYYGWINNVFFFGSELTAFKPHPKFKADINRDSLTLLLRYSSIPAPYSIYQNIFKLEPGNLISISASDHTMHKESYWGAVDLMNHGLKNPFGGSPQMAVNELNELLMDAIGKQMISDVPLGAFLSGGVDSSTIAAMMQAQSTTKIKTFSIGFYDGAYNEAEHARQVAKHLGTDHYDLYVSSKDALDVIPRIPSIYSEPFADSSQIPTHLVAHIAKQKVTVSLSGDAGDELFGGYRRYKRANRSWNTINSIPLMLRTLGASSICSVSPSLLNSILSPLDHLESLGIKPANWAYKLQKAATVLRCSNPISYYQQAFMSHNFNPKECVLFANEPPTLFNQAFGLLQSTNFMEQMMAMDMLTYLPSDILTKVDRAAMSVSLETRIPFLDHRVVEFAWSLPMEYKINNGIDKWVLREVLYKYVPKSMIERPKMGFAVPLANWLRGPLKDWTEALLDEKRLQEEHFFNVPLVRQKWQEHLSGHRNWQYQLWDILMFQAWLEKEKRGA